MNREEAKPSTAKDTATEVSLALKSSDTAASLRKLCRGYGEDDLYEAIKYIPVTPQWDSHRKIIRDEIDRFRHKQIESRLVELKERHWTLVPTFWLVVVGTVAGIIAAITGVISCYDDSRMKSDSAPPVLNPLQQHPQNKPLLPSKSPPETAPPTTNSVASPAAPKK